MCPSEVTCNKSYIIIKIIKRLSLLSKPTVYSQHVSGGETGLTYVKLSVRVCCDQRDMLKLT